MRKLYKHNGTWYSVIRYLPFHNVQNSDNSINMDVLKEWRDWVGANHVLRDEGGYMLCEVIEEAKISL